MISSFDIVFFFFLNNNFVIQHVLRILREKTTYYMLFLENEKIEYEA
jgi:hypothetical protein